MASKIEDIIDEIEAYIDECKPVAFSTNKIAVNRDELESLLQELRTKTPEEIRRYQKIISNREAILAEAQQKADAIISAAQIQTNELVSEHEIMQKAYAQANEVVMIANNTAKEKIDRATEDANQIRLGAIAYTDELLSSVQGILAASIETTRSRSENFLATMQTYLDTVEQNRAVLMPEEPKGEQANATAPEAPATTPVKEEKKEEDDIPALDIPEGFFNKE